MTMLVAIPSKTRRSCVPLLLTPRKLLEKVKKDSKCDQNLVSSSVELFKICSLPNFPHSISEEIEDKILGCYANLIVNPSFCPTYQEEKTAWRCYQRSSNHELCEFYLTQIISRSIMLVHSLNPELLCDPGHEDFERSFIKDRIAELHRAERQAERSEVVNYISWQDNLSRKYRRAYEEYSNELSLISGR